MTVTPVGSASAGGAADRRERLLGRVVDYVLEHGIADLTLRRLADAVGSNNRMLLYYFSSREEIIVAALTAAEARFPGMQQFLVHLDDATTPLDERLRAAWATIADPANLPFHRLFFQVFGLAGFERDRYADLLGTIATEWVDHVSAAIVAADVPAPDALTLAHELVALWRGLQATLIGQGDTAAVHRAATAGTSALLARIRLAAAH
ncbi:TetR/AcrR family transcriptional regulator [Cryobacterium sp. SO2]|uniref:TetR/AcrR family transcriptional regulator n=1 Tax=Cryobacterium sp. SO2 TaxID=1897060 RepID=UPI00223D5DC3|nr:TetR/AcrR family transcriptional regulator [Cryobacterium sp. SO2]WEO77846.1 TetR/AcrR family transcriptional regulator [Cryobacterium sp. SO2]